MSEDEDIVTVGSSEVPIILGVHRYQSPWDLWPRLVGLAPRWNNDRAAHMQTGNDVEELLIPVVYKRRFDVELVPGPRFGGGGHTVGPEPWMRAHVDFHRGDSGRIVEAKKIRSWHGWGDDGTDDAPVDVIIQVMWQQIVNKQDDAEIFAWCSMDEQSRVYHVPWQPERAQSLQSQVSEWYERHVIDCEPISLDETEACNRNLSLLYPGNGGKIWKNAEPGDLKLARERHRIAEQIDDLQGKLNWVESRIKDRIGDDYGIRGVARWSPTKRGTRQFAPVYIPGALDQDAWESEHE